MIRWNFYRPLLQVAHYSPLPIRNRKTRLKRIKRNDVNNVEGNEGKGSRILTRFENEVNPITSIKYSWTDYERIPSHQSTRVIESQDEGIKRKKTTKPVVNIPKNDDGILHPTHPASQLLSHSALVVVRQLEMMNLFIGFEQANKYRILSPNGDTVGYLAEEEQGLSGTLFRQLAGTHRAFRASIMNQDGQEVLRIKRPFSLINSRILIHTVKPMGHALDNSTAHGLDIIGEAQQEFHIWRRKYNLFTRLSPTHNGLEGAEGEEERTYEQFAKIDAGFLSWDFYAQDGEARLNGSITRNFTGFGREIFTDTGQYVIRFDAIENEINSIQQPDRNPTSDLSLNNLPSTEVGHTGLTLDQRAVLLATAVSIDFDYFSRTHRGGLFPPIFFGGGSSSDDL